MLGGCRKDPKPSGHFFVIEPWRTPFLNFVHAVVEQPVMRKLYAKGDALAAMTDRERATYERWLGQPRQILDVFHKHFASDRIETRWGKLAYIGAPQNDVTVRANAIAG